MEARGLFLVRNRKAFLSRLQGLQLLDGSVGFFDDPFDPSGDRRMRLKGLIRFIQIRFHVVVFGEFQQSESKIAIVDAEFQYIAVGAPLLHPVDEPHDQYKENGEHQEER